jgi:hypothetical protein
LEQAICKWFIIVKNDEEVYMQLQNISTTNHLTCWSLLWTPIETNKLSIG